MTPDNRSDLASTKENSRPSSPHLVAPQPIRTVWGGSKSGSKSGTPKGGSRAGTPSRVQQDPSVEFFKKSGMVNNLGLSDPREQDRASDLLGHPGTEPIRDPPTEEELEKVKALAAALEKKKKK